MIRKKWVEREIELQLQDDNKYWSMVTLMVRKQLHLKENNFTTYSYNPYIRELLPHYMAKNGEEGVETMIGAMFLTN